MLNRSVDHVESNDYCHNSSGPTARPASERRRVFLEGEERHLDIAPNAVLRMTPTLQKGDHARFRTTGTAGVGMIDYSHDKAELSDDGEFLQARYVGMEEAERVLNRIRLELF